MRSLFKDILLYFKCSFGGLPFTKANLSDLLADVLKNHQSRLKKIDGQIKLDKLPTIDGDTHQLKLVFEKLFDNAIQFRGDEPLIINVTCRPENDNWHITAADNGKGIDPSQQEHLFDVCLKDSGEKSQQSFGLGLPICKKIIERHGGRLWVKSTPDQGTSIHLVLPQNQD